MGVVIADESSLVELFLSSFVFIREIFLTRLVNWGLNHDLALIFGNFSHNLRAYESY